MAESSLSSHQPQKIARDARATQRRSRRLFSVGACAVAVMLGYYAYSADVQDPIHRYEGLLMLFLAILPSLLWARRGGEQLPVFEVFMLTAVNTYALPFLNSSITLRAYAPELVTYCGFVVLLFQGITICTHAAIQARAGTTKFFTEEILTENMQRYLGIGLVLATVYTFVMTYYSEIIPYELGSVLRAVFRGIGLVTTFVLARRWGQNQLGTNERLLLVVMLGMQVALQFSTLFLVDGMSIIVLALVGYVAGSKQLPIIPIVAILAVVAILHNGKGTMRAKYWDEYGNHREITLAGLPAFFAEWFDDGLTLNSSTSDEKLMKLLDRTSLIHMLCLVASYSPDHQPFLNGQTYAQIPGQFVPGFLWSGKPPGHVSTYTLSVYYGLQTNDDTAKTTIGFGFIPEAYANFGMTGVCILGFLFGAFYKKVQAAAAQSSLLSYPGLFLIVLMAWSFQTEMPMSLWLSSMYQACVGVIGVPFLLKNFMG